MRADERVTITLPLPSPSPSPVDYTPLPRQCLRPRNKGETHVLDLYLAEGEGF